MSTTINDVIGQLNSLYAFLNEKLNAGLPENVVFTVIPNRGKGNILGWFAKNRWQKGEETLHEINITADKLNRSFEEIAETLIHEMCHLSNHIGRHYRLSIQSHLQQMVVNLFVTKKFIMQFQSS